MCGPVSIVVEQTISQVLKYMQSTWKFICICFALTNAHTQQFDHHLEGIVSQYKL